MNVLARAGLAAGGLTAGAAVAHRFDAHARAEDARHEEAARGKVAAARTEWSAWKQAVDADFPGMRLDTPADHARFAAFLEQNPPPEWVDARHEGYSRIRLSADSSFMGRYQVGRDPKEQPMVVAIGAGFALGGGGVMSHAVATGRATPLATVGATAGLGLLAAFGAGAAYSAATMPADPPARRDGGDLVREVRSIDEANRPAR